MKDMMMVRINFDFPREEYAYLKMMCTKTGTTIKALTSKVLIEQLEDFEDEHWLKDAEKILENTKEQDLISWEDIKKELSLEL